MKKYYFYSATGSGVVSLQFPGAASSVGVAQNGKVYQVKSTTGVIAGVTEGSAFTEAALVAAIVAAFAGAKVTVETIDSKSVFLLN